MASPSQPPAVVAQHLPVRPALAWVHPEVVQPTAGPATVQALAAAWPVAHAQPLLEGPQVRSAVPAQQNVEVVPHPLASSVSVPVPLAGEVAAQPEVLALNQPSSEAAQGAAPAVRMVEVKVQIPAAVGAGQRVDFTGPDGQDAFFHMPDAAHAGSVLTLQYPSRPNPPASTTTPVVPEVPAQPAAADWSCTTWPWLPHILGWLAAWLCLAAGSKPLCAVLTGVAFMMGSTLLQFWSCTPENRAVLRRRRRAGWCTRVTILFLVALAVTLIGHHHHHRHHGWHHDHHHGPCDDHHGPHHPHHHGCDHHRHHDPSYDYYYYYAGDDSGKNIGEPDGVTAAYTGDLMNWVKSKYPDAFKDLHDQEVLAGEMNKEEVLAGEMNKEFAWTVCKNAKMKCMRKGIKVMEGPCGAAWEKCEMEAKAHAEEKKVDTRDCYFDEECHKKVNWEKVGETKSHFLSRLVFYRQHGGFSMIKRLIGNAHQDLVQAGMPADRIGYILTKWLKFGIEKRSVVLIKSDTLLV